jgi:Lipoxygenase
VASAVLARHTLASFGENSFGDYMSSVGTGQFMQLIGKYWEQFDFFKSCALPDELAQRGFTPDFDIPAYLYREDGMLVWNAYGDFIKDFLDEIYPSDEDVAADKGLQDFAREIAAPDKACVKGFPEGFDDKATLGKAMQTIWWICSGLHAAVNYPQYEVSVRLFIPNST